MLYAFEKYKKSDAGYWLRSYIQNGANIERQHVLIDLSGTDFSSCDYFTEDWFKELYKDSKVKEYCGNTAGTVVQVTAGNSNFDNTFINRHAHKEFQPDILDALFTMKKAGASDAVMNGFLRNYLKSVFDEYAESFKRIYAVINEAYDPLYNVDVEDKETHSGKDTDTKSGSDTTAHTGTATLTDDGKDTKTTTGNVEDTKSGSETVKDGNNSRTETNNTIFVFDSNSPVNDSGSETILETEKTTSFTNRKDTRTYNSLKDETSYDSSHETEYDEAHETTYDSKLETGYGHIITRTKKGNQGVTMSQDMLEREISSWTNIDFLKYVVDTVARDMLLY